MKRIYSLLLAATGAIGAQAQTGPAPMPARRPFVHDDMMLPWVFEINVKGGGLMQDLTSQNSDANYPNGLNLNTGGKLKFEKGSTWGADAQLGYFFGPSRSFGIGAGFMYLRQQGNLVTTDKYHVEYQATDSRGNVFRQLITSTDKVKEELTITNMNIPVMLKFKKRFCRAMGISVDAGALLNVRMRNEYKADATFDYEAIYRYATDANGAPTSQTIYDNNTTPASNSVLYTRAAYDGRVDVNTYFNQLRASGYNVGLGVAPTDKRGTVNYNDMSVGLLVQPALNFFLGNNTALVLGGYYMYQPVKNDYNMAYQLSNTVGNYASVMNNVSAVKAHSFGGNVGLRFFFGRLKDTDHDGVADRMDHCPSDSGVAILGGCPDRDGDGVPDYMDSCASVAGLMKYNGCPDSDGDGILDKDDACPTLPGLAQYNGCPDRDGDGVPDKDDNCPDKAGSTATQGCPDTDGDGLTDDVDKCPEMAGPADNNGCPVPPKVTVQEDKIKVNTPIRFQVNKTVIQKESYPTLAQAVVKLAEDPNAIIIVDGYTDASGKAKYNKALALKRANAVKAYLKKMGINPKRVKVIGHGPANPIADNTTREGRLKNRRAVMTLSVGE